MGVPDTMRYAILLNGNSASALELFSGCLRNLDRAVLVGEHTYGKGTGTITMPLDDGSAINITVFKYYLPNGDNLEDVGIKPDALHTFILIYLCRPCQYRHEAVANTKCFLFTRQFRIVKTIKLCRSEERR